MCRKLLVCSFLLLSALSVYAQKVVIVEAEYDGWTDSGINITSGQVVCLLGYGLANTNGKNPVNFNNFSAWGGPAGNAADAHILPEVSWNFLATGLPQNALVGKIGSGDPFVIGTMVKVTASNSGRLYLGYNDQRGSFTDNMGQFVCFVITASGPAKVSQNNIIKKEFSLSQNYPNPFNPQTEIKYTLQEPGKIILKIYNSLGQKVKTIVEESKTEGEYSVHWDGTNDRGTFVSSGQYFYQLSKDNKIITKKALLLN